MPKKLKVFFANIEKGTHLKELTIPKVKKMDPDVVAFAEVRGDHLELINEALDMKNIYFTSAKGSEESFHGIPHNVRFGLAIFIGKNLEFIDQGINIYHLMAEDSPHSVGENGIPIYRKRTNSVNRAIFWAKVQKDNRTYVILLTHFTWTPDAVADKLQLKDFNKMLKVIDEEDSFSEGFVLVGDLNAPRVVETADPPYSPNRKDPIKGEIWSKLASFYKDNIPQNVASTIDPKLHRIPTLKLCVDCCFTHGNHVVSDKGVAVIEGVSDHKGLFFEIVKI